jgi:hypothetical protein
MQPDLPSQNFREVRESRQEFLEAGLLAVLFAEQELTVYEIERAFPIFQQLRISIEILFRRDVLAQFPAATLVDSQDCRQISGRQRLGLRQKCIQVGRRAGFP